MSTPDDRKYTKSHEWVKADGDEAVVGITAYAVEQLSDLVFVDLPDSGEDAEAGSSFGEIESVKAVSELNAPVSGEITDVNDDLADDLDRLKSDPWDAGWMIRIRMSDTSQLEGLMDAGDYQKMIADAE